MAADPRAPASLRDWARFFQEAAARAARQFFPGAVRDPDDPGPVTSDWRPAPNHAPFIPNWADPEWSPTVQFSDTGREKRDIYVTTGEVLRPAILPRDAAKNPTDFARRFGIYPKARPDDEDPAVGRSLVTPTTTGPNQADAGVYTLGDAEAWQSYIFSGPTMKEMIDHRVYVPDYESSEPGLQGDLHPLLTRNRWLSPRQMRLGGVVNNFRWKFGDVEGAYDPADYRVWQAIQPALQLVSRVLYSNPPYLNAILSLYHLRPVPENADGRTQEARDESGAPLPALWIDENRPGMYTEAAELRQLGFKSRQTAEAILDKYLRFGICMSENALDAQGMSFDTGLRNPLDPTNNILIFVHPSIVWQLLTTEFPEARVATTFHLADTILHEFAVSERHFEIQPEWNELLIQIFCLTARNSLKTDSTLQAIQDVDLGITPEMVRRFPLLCRSLLGRPDGPHALRYQGWFFQEGPQLEEGRSFENELWGLIPHLGNDLGYNPGDLTYLQPYIRGKSWPTSHVAVDLQHEDVNRSKYAPYATSDYNGFLLTPPAPVHDQVRPVRVDDYAQFLSESFWQSQFTRFGHQALKLVPSEDALMVLYPRGNRLVKFEIRREMSVEDYNYFAGNVLPLLRNLRQFLLADWLVLETNEIVLEQVTHHRLHYEARTWIKTYGDIISLLNKSVADINQIGGEITRRIPQGRQGRLSAALQRTIKLQRYAQSVIAMYSLLPQPSQRQSVHLNHMAPLRRHLTAVRNKQAVFITNLQGFVTAAASVAPGGVDSQSFLAPEVQVLADYIDAAVQSAYTNRANLNDSIALLADDLVNPGFDYSTHPDTLPHVPQARKRISTLNAYRRAAERPLAYLGAIDRNRAIVAVQKWLAVLARVRGDKEGNFEAYPVNMDVDPPGAGPQPSPGAGPQPSPGSSPRIPGAFPT